MRDRLIHGYFAINDQLVVEVVEKELPVLKGRVQDLIEMFKSGSDTELPSKS